MRMWMVNPKIMCNYHLLGEHRELHMLLGSLKKRRSITGYIKSNCIEPLSIKDRHDALVEEMKRRGWTGHKTFMDVIEAASAVGNLTLKEMNVKIDKEKALEDLLSRCSRCYIRWIHNKSILSI